ncbi:unnamed protein product [Effrenium voratum]|uniref:Aspartyl/asparaginy/proline hydroxylase domain-containing protein n=1 Tax=Effrenium voratum TaxID=2562239 RepID=A0AA36I6U2_9DINO|nr:unnamed protein product [Effrenium voratum]CAJ1439789.1 unnamed protein product [Effrenium voratum]
MAMAGESEAASAISDPETRVLRAVDKVLDEWFVTGLHRAGAKKFIQEKICKGNNEECLRARQWLLLRMNGRIWEHGIPLMCRSAENVPGLRSLPVWPRQETPWLEAVEAWHERILSELMAVRAASERSGFQPYRDPAGSSSARKPADGLGVEGVDRGMWNVLYLFLNHKRFEDNCARFPSTVAAIQEAFPRHYSHAFVSALTPGSHIVKHHGPSNRMLRVWLPLCGFEGFRLRVGDQILEPKAGHAFVWDHSYEHEAWHEGTETRLVLIVDIWHPDLRDAEVKFLGTLQSCRLRAGKTLAEMEERSLEEATYFEIVEKARSLLTDDDWWVVKAQRDPTIPPT